MSQIMAQGQDEVARDQPAYPGAAESIAAIHRLGFVQTVLTGNLRSAAEAKLRATGLDQYLDFSIGGYGCDARDRFSLPRVVADRYQASYGHDLEPARTVVIGDAPNDIACARFAGFRVVDPDGVVEAVTSLVQPA
jgi:phosphoglycolate phosphatase-like HAD superfamily hydrolase